MHPAEPHPYMHVQPARGDTDLHEPPCAGYACRTLASTCHNTTRLVNELTSRMQRYLRGTCCTLHMCLTVLHYTAQWIIHSAMPACLAHQHTIMATDHAARLILSNIIADVIMQHATLAIMAWTGWHMLQTMGIMQLVQLAVPFTLTMAHLIVPVIITYTLMHHPNRRARAHTHRTSTWTLTGQHPMCHGIAADLGGLHSIKASLA